MFEKSFLPAILLFPYPQACGRKNYILLCVQKWNLNGRADQARLSANKDGVVRLIDDLIISMVSPL